MRKFLKEYFAYSRRELKSLYFFLLLLIFSFFLGNFHKTEKCSLKDNLQDSLIIIRQNFLSQLEIKSYEQKKRIVVKETDKFNSYFYFDPNTIDSVKILKLGLSERVISNLMNYRKKGGFFKEAKDLKKIYGLDDDKYKNLEKWIRIEQRKKNQSCSEAISPEVDSVSLLVSKQIFDINSVEYKDLIRILSGNKIITSRILKYRNLLGGYYCMNQLNEVYDMNDSVLFELKKHFYIDSLNISVLSVNNSSYLELLHHPYFNKEEVKLILKYREFKKSCINLNEFYSSGLLPDTVLFKVVPYLSE